MFCKLLNYIIYLIKGINFKLTIVTKNICLFNLIIKGDYLIYQVKLLNKYANLRIDMLDKSCIGKINYL